MLKVLFGFWLHEIWKLFCFRCGVSYWVMYTCKNSVAWPLDNKIYRHCLVFRLFRINCCLGINLRVNLYVIKPKPTKEAIADFVYMQRRSPAILTCDFNVCLYCHYLFCHLCKSTNFIVWETQNMNIHFYLWPCDIQAK